jgi:hypothetical protein
LTVNFDKNRISEYEPLKISPNPPIAKANIPIEMTMNSKNNIWIEKEKHLT